MTDYDWEWQKLKAESEFKDLDGDAFESRFQQIAKKRWKTDFTPTIPMGRRGDLKCDGFRHSTGTVFQCYGPRYGQADVERALDKIEEDFRGAIGHWGRGIKEWIFVINVYRDKIPSEIILKIQKLSEELKVKASIMSRSELLSTLSELSESDRVDLFGRAPRSTDMPRVTYANLGRALSSIKKEIVADDLEIVMLSTTIIEKVKYNSLPDSTKKFLLIGQTGAAKVEKYLSEQAYPEEAERMAQGFRERYARCVGDALEPEEIFGEMVKFAGGATGDPDRDAAALAIVTHFFVTCQIFEIPFFGVQT